MPYIATSVIIIDIHSSITSSKTVCQQLLASADSFL